MTVEPGKFWLLLRSRKFWALIVALVGLAAGVAVNEITVWQALQGGIAALAAYMTGTAIEDAGRCK